MPYLLISTTIRLETGPTFVGDKDTITDELADACEAKPIQELGRTFPEWVSPHPPSRVLNICESLGWRVVAMAGIGQTCVWTLHQDKKE